MRSIQLNEVFCSAWLLAEVAGLFAARVQLAPPSAVLLPAAASVSLLLVFPAAAVLVVLLDVAGLHVADAVALQILQLLFVAAFVELPALLKALAAAASLHGVLPGAGSSDSLFFFCQL